MDAFFSNSFFYGTEMEVVMLATAFAACLINYYLCANLMMAYYNAYVSRKVKLVFALALSIMAMAAWTYPFYVANGCSLLTPAAHAPTLMPNPLLAAFIYYAGMNLLKLSHVNSLTVAFHIFVYMTVSVLLSHFIALVSVGPRFIGNHAVEIAMLIEYAIINFCCYAFAALCIDRYSTYIRAAEGNIVRSVSGKTTVMLVMCVAVYLFSSGLHMLMGDAPASCLLIAFILVLFLTFIVLRDNLQVMKHDMVNKDMHINTLIDSIDEFRGVKHDFNNILHTYGGYLTIGDLDKLKQYHQSLLDTTLTAAGRMEIGELMEGSPELAQLLLAKAEAARHLGVVTAFDIHCGLSDVVIAHGDILTIVEYIMDRATEAAAHAEEPSLTFTIGQKPANHKLMVIGNSTSAAPPKRMRGVDAQLRHIRDIVRKYDNCTIHATHYGQLFTVYLDLACRRSEADAKPEEGS